MASRCVTRSLRTLTNLLHDSHGDEQQNTTTTIRPVFMECSYFSSRSTASMTAAMPCKYAASSGAGSSSRGLMRSSRTSSSFSKGAASKPKRRRARRDHVALAQRGRRRRASSSAWRKSTQKVEMESTSRRRSRSGSESMPRGLLAEAQQLGAQFVLHLRAVERVVDVERR